MDLFMINKSHCCITFNISGRWSCVPAVKRSGFVKPLILPVCAMARAIVMYHIPRLMFT